MNANPYNTMAYENKSNWTLGENKPNSNPIRQACVVCEGVAGLIKPNPSGLRCLLRSCRTDQTQFPSNPANFSSESQISNRIFPVLCVFSVASLLFLSIMDCKIVNIQDTPFVRRNQLLTASAISWISYSASTGTTVIRIRRLSEDKSQDIAETFKRLWYQWSPDGQALALSTWTSQPQFRPFCATITPTNRVCTCLGGGLNGLMNKNLDVITHAVTLIIKAAIMAARFSGMVRKRSL